MFDIAIKAGLPLISVKTDDPLNYFGVISHYVGEHNAVKVEGLKTLGTRKVSVMVSPEKMAWTQAYNMLLEEDKTLVVVNPVKQHPLMFDAGELIVPTEMIASELAEGGLEERLIKQLVPVLSGLSLIRIGEVYRLAQTSYGELTVQSVNAIKMQLYDSGGLVGVDTHTDFYVPNKSIEEFGDNEGMFLTEHKDDALAPRGMLIHGVPGCGKSQAAKYLAREWEIPLYMLDLSLIMNKYIGESENNMRVSLAKIDAESPCILLLDEVEKLFGSTDDKGTTSRVLGQLLWWLQEHRSRVFTVMTSNDISILPKELYRPGRIDMVAKLPPLTGIIEIRHFAEQALAIYNAEYQVPFNMMDFVIKFQSVEPHKDTKASHASVVSKMKHWLKQAILKGMVKENE